MPYSIAGTSSPLIVLPRGVSRPYDPAALVPAERAALKSAVPWRPGQTWRKVSQENRRTLLLDDLRVRTSRLSAGIRLFDLPDRTNWTDFRLGRASVPDSMQVEAADRAPTDVYQFQVVNVAQAQTNTSATLLGADEAILEAGDYTFDLTVDDRTTSVRVSVNRSGPGADTNLDLLAKVGRQIEAADDRLETEVVTSSGRDENNLSVEKAALVVRSRTAGPGTSFCLSDSSGNLVDTLKLDQSAPAAGPSRMIFDHQIHESDGNELYFDGAMLSVNLAEATGPDETIEVTSGLAALSDQARGLVSQFNEYVEFLKQHTEDFSGTILQDLVTELDSNQRRLREIGLLPNADGNLMVGDGFDRALATRPGQVKSVLTGSEGFLTGVKQVLDAVLDRDVSWYGRDIQVWPSQRSGASGYAAGLRNGLHVSVSV